MIKKILITLSILSTYEIMAMKRRASDDIIIEKSNQKICYFGLLPVEIQSYIAFLAFVFESEDEFIARTKNIRPVIPGKYYTHFLTPSKFKTTDHRAVLCPDETKVAIIESLHSRYACCKKPVLTIAHKATKNIIHQQELKVSASLLIALSSCGNIYANIESKYNSTRIDVDRTLIVQNIITQKKQEFVLPDKFYEFFAVHFNKQSTQVIVHGNKFVPGKLICEGDYLYSSYVIFTLENGFEPQNTQQNLLNYYFLQYQVCKTL